MKLIDCIAAILLGSAALGVVMGLGFWVAARVAG